jgi:hypothetical protein
MRTTVLLASCQPGMRNLAHHPGPRPPEEVVHLKAHFSRRVRPRTKPEVNKDKMMSTYATDPAEYGCRLCDGLTSFVLSGRVQLQFVGMGGDQEGQVSNGRSRTSFSSLSPNPTYQIYLMLPILLDLYRSLCYGRRPRCGCHLHRYFFLSSPV